MSGVGRRFSLAERDGLGTGGLLSGDFGADMLSSPNNENINVIIGPIKNKTKLVNFFKKNIIAHDTGNLFFSTTYLSNDIYYCYDAKTSLMMEGVYYDVGLKISPPSPQCARS